MNRTFSLEDDFMNWETDDLLYGFMRSISTANPTGNKTVNGKIEYKEYLLKKKFVKNKKLIADICGCSTRTVDNRLNKLMEKGLVEEDTIEVMIQNKPTEAKCYRFPIDTELGLFQVVDQEVLKYLVSSKNAFGIRIYVYLLDKYQYKKNRKNEGNYIFTLAELGKAFGYSTTTKTCNAVFRNVLTSLRQDKLIKYNHIQQQVELGVDGDNVITTERLELVFVAERKADLPVF